MSSFDYKLALKFVLEQGSRGLLRTSWGWIEEAQADVEELLKIALKWGLKGSEKTARIKRFPNDPKTRRGMKECCFRVGHSVRIEISSEDRLV